MGYLLAILLAWIAPDTDLMASDRHADRERGSRSLRHRGLLAVVPAAWQAERHPDAEVRSRCRRYVADVLSQIGGRELRLALEALDPTSAGDSQWDYAKAWAETLKVDPAARLLVASIARGRGYFDEGAYMHIEQPECGEYALHCNLLHIWSWLKCGDWMQAQRDAAVKQKADAERLRPKVVLAAKVLHVVRMRLRQAGVMVVDVRRPRFSYHYGFKPGTDEYETWIDWE